MRDFLKMKFGTSDTDELRRRSEPLRQAGERVGIKWNKERKMVNTVDSHCLAELAHAQGKGDAMIGELFSAYFERGEDINDVGVLCTLADKVGVSGARPCLELGKYRAGVLGGYEAAFKSGITSVPHFTLRVGAAEPARFSGAQSLEAFAGIISQLLQVAELPSGSRVRLDGKADGDVVSFQGTEGDRGCFVVKLLDRGMPSDGSAGLVHVPRDRLEAVWAFPPGAEVELKGLSAAELNGRRGEVVRHHGERGRFEVRLRGEAGSTKALRGDNLAVLRTLLPGDVVELGGLKAAHLNGQRGEVLGYLPDTERFEVRLHADGQVKAIQGEKLQNVCN